MSRKHQGTALATGASSGLGAVAQRTTSATRRSVEVVGANLTDRAALDGVKEILNRDASITLPFNNAGVGTHTPLLESKIEAMAQMIELNITALTCLTYAVAPRFIARGKGALINVSSVPAMSAEKLNGVYGGSKAFVLAFSQSLHRELANKACKCKRCCHAQRANFGVPVASRSSICPRKS